MIKSKPLVIPTTIAYSHSFFSLSPKTSSHFFLFFTFMDSPKIYHSRLKTSITLILIIFLTLFTSNLEGSQNLKKDHGNKSLINQKKLVLGSRPPRCVNKCLNCRPCMATLVISPHHKVGHIHKAKLTAEKDEGYYLLSWKCKCGNKLFQP